MQRSVRKEVKKELNDVGQRINEVGIRKLKMKDWPICTAIAKFGFWG